MSHHSLITMCHAAVSLPHVMQQSPHHISHSGLISMCCNVVSSSCVTMGSHNHSSCCFLTAMCHAAVPSPPHHAVISIPHCSLITMCRHAVVSSPPITPCHAEVSSLRAHMLQSHYSMSCHSLSIAHHVTA